jgi:hypothetical protein
MRAKNASEEILSDQSECILYVMSEYEQGRYWREMKKVHRELQHVSNQ